VGERQYLARQPQCRWAVLDAAARRGWLDSGRSRGVKLTLLQLDWRGPSIDLNQNGGSAVAFVDCVNDANEVLEDTLVDTNAVTLNETN
jgi:hypothetical protein